MLESKGICGCHRVDPNATTMLEGKCATGSLLKRLPLCASSQIYMFDRSSTTLSKIMPVSRSPLLSTPPPSSPYPQHSQRPFTRLQARRERDLEATQPRDIQVPPDATPVSSLRELTPDATPVPSPRVVHTYARRRTIALSRLLSPELTPPPVARAGSRAVSPSPDLSVYCPPSVLVTTPSEVFPTISEIFRQTKPLEELQNHAAGSSDEATTRGEDDSLITKSTPSTEKAVNDEVVRLIESLGKCGICWSFMGIDCHV